MADESYQYQQRVQGRGRGVRAPAPAQGQGHGAAAGVGGQGQLRLSPGQGGSPYQGGSQYQGGGAGRGRGRGYSPRDGGVSSRSSSGDSGSSRSGSGSRPPSAGGPGQYSSARYHQARVGPPSWSLEPLPEYSIQDLDEIDKKFGKTGWAAPFPYASKEDVVLQVYTGPAARECKETISISVNHYPLEKFRFPESIFHYEVTMERVKKIKKDADKKVQPPSRKQQGPKDGKGKKHLDKSGKKGPQPEGGGNNNGGPPRRLPKPLPQLVLQVVLDRIRQNTGHFGVVSDLSSSVYSTMLLPEEDLVHVVNLTASVTGVDQMILQEDDDGDILATLSQTELHIDTQKLQAHWETFGTFHGYGMDTRVRTTLEQVYNAVVKSMPKYRFLPLGRSNIARWPKQNPESYLGSNVVCWKGISANISMGWKPYLCADLAHFAFLDDTFVLDALKERGIGRSNEVNVNRWERWQMQEAKSFLKNVKVKYTVKGRTMAGPVTDVLIGSVSKETFYWEERRMEVSVWEYFKMQYGIEETLNRNGPCLLLRSRYKVPAELCVIKKGQSFSRKLDDKQTRNMLTAAKKDPNVLKQDIEVEISSLKRENNPVLEEWGVELGTQMLRLDKTRVLGAPQLRYGGGIMENSRKGDAVITPANGKWEVWDSNFKFREPKSLSAWGILTVGPCRELSTHNIESFAEQLRTFGRRKGIMFESAPLLEDLSKLPENPPNVKVNVDRLSSVFQWYKQQGCKLVVVIIPRKFSPLYAHVKQAAELNVGILTQCVVGQNVAKGMDSTVQNILLKLNGKLGGINHVILTPPGNDILKKIDILRCPMLIIGADVTHPPPGSMKRIGNKEVPIPSFAAVTASIDKTGMPFMMDIRAQRKADKGAAEVIQDLEEIVGEFITTFLRNTDGIRPRKIIYFRDGVGEGQFPEVLHTEMLAMRRACDQFKDYDGGKYEPCITFVTVQKRHKTRMFYHSSKGVVNPPPGTVVDQEIVHQTEMDFYLCSHAGMMGTSRPTRYHVLWDDSNFTADQIQTLTYHLCYMYIRCNKSVRMPAPTYYAHWAANRAKVLSEGLDKYFGDLDELNAQMKRQQDFVKEFPMHFV